MRIEINVTPNDLALLVVDIKFNRCKSKKVLQSILDTVRSEIEVNYEELEQLQIITNEAPIEGDNTENGKN